MGCGASKGIVCGRQRARSGGYNANTSALVKAVVTDFSSSEGRSTAQDGLKAKFAASQASDLKMKAIDSLRQVSRCSMQKLQTMQLRLKLGSAKLVKAPQKRRPRVVACSDLVVFK